MSDHQALQEIITEINFDLRSSTPSLELFAGHSLLTIYSVFLSQKSFQCNGELLSALDREDVSLLSMLNVLSEFDALDIVLQRYYLTVGFSGLALDLIDRLHPVCG